MKLNPSILKSASSVSNNFVSHGLPGPENITRRELDNGIVVLIRSNFNSPSVVFSGYLTAGGMLDPDQKLGLASFTASGLMRGTEKKNLQSIYDLLESVGASMGFSGGTHTTGFSGRALVEDFDSILGLFAECLKEPSFPDDQMEKLRALILTGLAIRAQDTAQMASLTLDQIIYQDHPYSRPEDGFPETILEIHRDDLAKFHREVYGPKGMVIVVVGAVDPEDAIEKINKHLGQWKNPGQILPDKLPTLKSLDKVNKKYIDIPGKSQADIILGVPGPERKDRGFLAAALGNNILGQFGMYGRIGNVVREKEGLAYYAYSSLNGGMGPGSWTVSAGVDPSNIDKTIDIVINELKVFINKEVEPEELDDSKANFIGRLPLSLEANAGVAGALINLERYNLGLDYYINYQDKIQKISGLEILETAQRFINCDRLGISIAGPN